MKAIFVIADQVGDGSSQIPIQPWFYSIVDFAGNNKNGYFAGNVFSPDQALLDAIGADARTIFAFVIDMDGKDMSYSSSFELPAFTRGKVTSWIVSNMRSALSNSSARGRMQVTRHILRETSGVPTADPLEGFRIGGK